MRLCQHAWPGAPATTGSRAGTAFCDIPASASSSVQKATTGLPLPELATNAVGSPSAFAVTVNPLVARYRISARLDLNSRNDNSGVLQSSKPSAFIASAFRSSQSKAAALSASTAPPTDVCATDGESRLVTGARAAPIAGGEVSEVATSRPIPAARTDRFAAAYICLTPPDSLAFALARLEENADQRLTL